MSEQFLSGLALNEAFFSEVVQPILAAAWPGLRYGAARLGYGSEVLGYDTPISMDHDWGPKMHLFLQEEDVARVGTAVVERLRHELPPSFWGISTNYSDPREDVTQALVPVASGPINHNIKVTTWRAFLQDYLGFDPREGMSVAGWLTTPQQLLLGVTAGAVFADDWGELAAVRGQLAYYPEAVWRYLLASQWGRIEQEEHFMGRTGDVGDELGSQLIAARLVHDLMQLAFLMERVYAPYPKWFGTAFARLGCAPQLQPLLMEVLAAAMWQERERPLCAAYELVAAMHNELGITAPLDTKVRDFFGRPYRVIMAGRFAEAIRATIVDEVVRGIRTVIGSIDQFSHSSDLREERPLQQRLRALFR